MSKLITLEQLQEAINADEGIGFCVECGEQSEGYCEPDARDYPCANCGDNKVYGAEELLIMGEYE